MKTEYIMGVPVDVVTMARLMSELPKRLDSHAKTTYTSVNPQIVTHIHKFPEILEFIEASTYRIPDGVGILKVSKMQGGNISERVTGIELMYQLLDFAHQHKLGVFLYGARPEVVEQAAHNITVAYPNISNVDFVDGYTSLSDLEIVNKINQAQATFVFVALGFPKQELWLAENIHRIDARIFQDVGGSLDVISGAVKRAPEFFIKTNLEWAYRSVSNPKRLYRIAELPLFMWKSWRWFKKNKNELKL